MEEYIKKSEIYMRTVNKNFFKTLAGYDALQEVVAFLYQANATEENFDVFLSAALAVALKRVKGRRFLEAIQENTIIQDEQDVRIAIKELLRAAGVSSTVDEFIKDTVFEKK